MWNGQGVEAEITFFVLLLLIFTVAVDHEGRSHSSSGGRGPVLDAYRQEEEASSYKKIIVQSPFSYLPDYLIRTSDSTTDDWQSASTIRAAVRHMFANHSVSTDLELEKWDVLTDYNNTNANKNTEARVKEVCRMDEFPSDL